MCKLFKINNKRVQTSDTKASPCEGAQQNTEKNNIASPFQAIVTKKDSDFVNRDLLREISMETLKSPIIKNVKASLTLNEGEVELQQQQQQQQEETITDEEISEFAPKYILENDISSMSELKEMIARKKPPKISFIINNDFSRISQTERKNLDKIMSLDTKKIIGAIKKNIENIDSVDRLHSPPRRYKLACVSEADPVVEKKDSFKQKYLSADEIIAIRRREADEKKAKADAFADQISDVKSPEDFAKLYYIVDD